MTRVSQYLDDMLIRIERIEQATSEGKVAFEQSFIIQDAVIRNYEVIGEIAKRLPEAVLELAPEINWTSIKGFRDFLAHSYDRVDLQLVWTAVDQLPALRAAVMRIRDSM